jgi:hypothetical protein
MMRRIFFVIGALAALETTGAAADPIYWFTRSGQSLSIGSVGYCGSGSYPACSTGASFGNLSLTPFKSGPPYAGGFPGGAFETLHEDECKQSAGGATCSPPHAESSATSMCNQFATLSGQVCGTANYGWNGASYAALKKGTAEYQSSIGGPGMESGAYQAQQNASAEGRVVYAPGVYFNQGESDGNATAAQYEGYMVELQSDYERDLNAALGQHGRVPLFIMQKSNWASATAIAARTTPTNGGGADAMPIGQLQACLDHYSDGKIFCVGPDYATPYGGDGLHKPASAYRTQGGREGAAMYQVTVERRGWRPFYPRSISIAGNVITAQFWVPVGALVLDTTNIAPLADGNMGFEFSDTGGSEVTLPENAVALKPGTTDSVTITLSGVPAGTFELRYAWTAAATGAAYSGPTKGPRGNVADSAGTSWAGDSLRNYAFTFRIPNISAASPYTWAPPDPDLSSIPGPSQRTSRGSAVDGKTTLQGKGALGHK